MPSVTGEVVRLGVVGAGLVSQIAHLPALGELRDRFAVTALADPSERVRDTVARRHSIAATFATPEALIERAPLDAVLVAAPNGTHAHVTLAALDAGLHVLVEKPLCLTEGDAWAIVDRAARRGLVAQVGYMKRFDPAYEALRACMPRELRLIAVATVDPGIGVRFRPGDFVAATDVDPEPVEHATAEQVAVAVGSDDPCHLRPFSDAFLGALIHDVNLVQGLLEDLGPVTDAAAAADGTLALASGGTVRWTVAWMLLPGRRPFREQLQVFAADGLRRLTLGAPYDATTTGCLEVDGETRRFAPGPDSYRRQLEHFHACVTAGAACRTPAAQGARDVALLTELYRTAVAA